MVLARLIFAVLFTTFLFGCANIKQKASNNISSHSAQGWGGTTCGEMLHDIDPANGGTKAGQNIGLYQSWISGFISGVNYSRNDIYDVSGDTSPNDSFDWVKNYCIQNPTTPVPLALHELILKWKKEGKVLSKADE